MAIGNLGRGQSRRKIESGERLARRERFDCCWGEAERDSSWGLRAVGRRSWASVVCAGDIWRARGLEANGIIVRMVGLNLSSRRCAVGNGSLWEWEETRFLPTRVGYKAPARDPVNFCPEFSGSGVLRHLGIPFTLVGKSSMISRPIQYKIRIRHTVRA